MIGCKTKKKSFILLETLIAVAMIGLCSSFFLSTPIKTYQRYLEDFKKIELSRIANHHFLSLQCELKEKHPWSSLKEEKETFFPLETVQVSLNASTVITYECGYQLRVKQTKEGPGDSFYKLLECIFYFSPSTEHFSWEKALESKKKDLKKFSYVIFISGAPKRKAIL
jgi:hypothetical protein